MTINQYLLLADLPLVFFDVETTGLLPATGDRICELALLRCHAGSRQEFETLVNPQRRISPRAFAVNGIRPEALVDAPIFADVVVPTLALLDGAVMVAHNASFDVQFLNCELARLGVGPHLAPTLDTLALARRLLRRSSYSLGALAVSFGLPKPTHRAMDDVRALQAVFEHLREGMRQLGVVTLGDALRYQRGLLPDQPDPEPPPLIAVAVREQRRLRLRYAGTSGPLPTDREVQPIELTIERGALCLRAFCYLRNDVRTFVIDRILSAELI